MRLAAVFLILVCAVILGLGVSQMRQATSEISAKCAAKNGVYLERDRVCIKAESVIRLDATK